MAPKPKKPASDPTGEIQVQTKGGDATGIDWGAIQSGFFGFPQQIGQAPGVLNLEMGIRRAPTPRPDAGRATGTPIAKKAQSPNQVMATISNLPESEMVAWKNAAYDAGLYDPSFYSKGLKPRQKGILDSQDRAAFQELMWTSATAPSGTTIQEVLDQLKQDNPYSAKNNYGKAVTEGLTQKVTVSDPATIRRYARAAATELLGRDLDDDTLNRLVGVMQGAEKQVGFQNAGKIQRAQAAAEGGADQTVVTESVDITARTEEQIRQENPGEIEAKGFATNMDAFFKMLSGGA